MAFENRLQYLFARRDLSAGASPAGEYWYRPGEILVNKQDVHLVADELERWGVRPLKESGYRRLDNDIDERCEPRIEVLDEEDDLTEAGEAVGVLRYEVPERINIPSLVRRLRQVSDGPEPRVGPHYILMGEQWYRGGPSDLPSPAQGQPVGTRPGNVTVAVLDTGIVKDPLPGDPSSFAFDEPRDLETLDLNRDGSLDDQAGHGTFIAGIVLRAAPTAKVQIARVLDSFGVGHELGIVRGMLRCNNVDLMNLSLGGYTDGDMPPIGLEAALEKIDAHTSIIAASGNNGSRRPMWPAAFKRVIAVGAYEQSDSGVKRASFSNHGSWVDACAPGVRVSSNFVVHDGPLAFRPDPDDFRGGASWSGTSFAAPLVAGRIAATTTPGRARETEFALVLAPGHDQLSGLGTIFR